jgi:hypothetical protein
MTFPPEMPPWAEVTLGGLPVVGDERLVKVPANRIRAVGDPAHRGLLQGKARQTRPPAGDLPPHPWRHPPATAKYSPPDARNVPASAAGRASDGTDAPSQS